MKKALAIGVILLFLGVGFQPALANEVSTNTVSDVDEDCLECQPVNRVELLKVKLLLIRLEVITNVILSRFGHIPEIGEKCGKILDVIHSNRVLDYPIICSILLYLGNTLRYIDEFLWSILDNHPNNVILYLIIYPLEVTIVTFIIIILGFWFIYDCYNWEPLY